MSHKQNCFVFEDTTDAFLENVLADMSVDGTQWIVKQINIANIVTGYLCWSFHLIYPIVES